MSNTQILNALIHLMSTDRAQLWRVAGLSDIGDESDETHKANEECKKYTCLILVSFPPPTKFDIIENQYLAVFSYSHRKME